VTLAQAELFGPFTRALLQQTARPAMRLGRAALALEDVLGTPGSHAWAGYSSFAGLAASAGPAPQVTLHFVTATAFGQGTRADRRPRLGLLPTPETVFKSLATRWNEWSPADLAIDLALVEAAARETLVSRYRIETTQISLGKGPQKGFVGTCTYELPPDQEPSRLLSQLADAAFYLGIGMKTARGMGLCRRGP
jgi:CRISPR-associated endoribonuclease Cas6